MVKAEEGSNERIKYQAELHDLMRKKSEKNTELENHTDSKNLWKDKESANLKYEQKQEKYDSKQKLFNTLQETKKNIKKEEKNDEKK